MLRRLLWLGVLVWIGFALLVVSMRVLVLPQIDRYRDDIARQISASLGSRVEIGHIDARWSGVRPHLDLGQVKVHDKDGRVALELGRVRTSLSWESLPALQLRLHRFEVEGPELQIRRDAAGRMFVAGIELTSQGGDSGLADWLLAQDEVVVRGAVVRWIDELRGVAELALRAVDLRLVNRGSRHLVGLTAEPPHGYARPIDLRGDFRGRSLDHPGDWRGQVYLAVDQADLAIWRNWVDYPVDLPQGRGGVRLWADLADKRLAGISGDVAFDDVQLRLRKDLPMIDLLALRGRFAAKLPVDGFELAATGLSLATRDDLQLEPMDLRVAWRQASGDKPPQGELTASELDLAALTQLAGHLPLDDGTRRALAEFAPRGKLLDLRAGWTGDRETLSAWQARARFADTGLQARGLLPGFTAVSGTIDASQAGGSATLNGRGASVSLPRVFPEPRIALDELDAQVRWTVANQRVDVHFPKVDFSNPDIAGSVAGHFNTRPQSANSPGDIDLTGSFKRGKAAEVWRYLPFVAGELTRNWVKESLRDGKAENIKLRVKGDLWEFPWIRDKGGEFSVSADFAGARLAYAAGWPELTNIAGTMLFHGERMVIQGKRANSLGAVISDTTAEIPDLTHPKDTRLVIRGRADGPTSEFLAFINASPVSEQLDQVTRGMRATGSGTLNLGIDMPLQHVADTGVTGSYQFAGNELVAATGMPPLTEASGKVEFTERTLTIRDAAARIFGAPLAVTAQTESDGKVMLGLAGNASIADLRRVADSPWFDHLSGSTAWRANVAVRGQSATLVVDSNLQGITSSLPEPLNKPAGTALPLRIELGKPPGAAAGSDEMHIALDQLLDVRLLRRRDGNKMIVERGGIGVREAATLPERGLAVAGSLGSFDLDAWRRLMAPAASGEAGTALPWSTLALRASELNAFGQHFSDLTVNARKVDGTWQARVDSREMTGDLFWREGERGRLQARLKNLALSEVRSTPPPSTPAEEADVAPRELPGLDVVADSFSLRGKPLGKLELVAVNRGNLWQIDRFSIVNNDGGITGEGQWRMADGARSGSDTQIVFKLQSANVGKMLERLGYEDAVRRGNARLEGRIGWQGAPTSIDYPSLSGELTLAVSSGQFNKLEPGVGRLLGVLSLQALPRRISLDFRDVFSDGFAFDSISGSMKVAQGVIRTEDLGIRGPSAKVQMSGSTDLAAETQDLRVRVQPTLSESVALGAAIANPVAGVAALVAQKVFKDPIEKIFSYEYGVSGTWSDPQVVKLAAAKSPSAPADGVR
ncbi:MAG: YhdP family protein [Candidatus Methylophosphatis roskildensis]